MTQENFQSLNFDPSTRSPPPSSEEPEDGGSSGGGGEGGGHTYELNYPVNNEGVIAAPPGCQHQIIYHQIRI